MPDFCITPDYESTYADITLKMSAPEQRDHVVYSSWFSYRQKRH